jgi:hypothetical protein
MPDVAQRRITTAMVQEALHLVVFDSPLTVQSAEPPCAWPRLCGERSCQFPRYFRDGAPAGLVARILLQLGYSTELLKDLDREHEVGEVVHPGVKIDRSRNAALRRIDDDGVKLLGFLQERQSGGLSWSALTVAALGPRPLLAFMDRRRRPWRY